MAHSSALLTTTQRNLLRSAVDSGAATGAVTSSQRQKIHEICSTVGDLAKRPERLLVAFKIALTEAVNDAKIPLGEERTAIVDRLVSVFIEELYGANAGTVATADDSREREASLPTPPKTPGLYDAHL
jgi:hypothetical protein